MVVYSGDGSESKGGVGFVLLTKKHEFSFHLYGWRRPLQRRNRMRVVRLVSLCVAR